MRDVQGGPLSLAPDGPIRHEVAVQLLESFYKQVMVDGFFHADPHPGNLMWQPEEDRLYFLDLGMAGEVGPDMRESMMLLLMAFWQEDVGFLTDVSLMLSGAIDRSDLDVEAFQEEIGVLMGKYRGASLKDIQLGPVLQEMTEISLRHGVPLPASLTLTAKGLAQIPSTWRAASSCGASSRGWGPRPTPRRSSTRPNDSGFGSCGSWRRSSG
jgi:ubiquinone biosynthesis protein